MARHPVCKLVALLVLVTSGRHVTSYCSRPTPGVAKMFRGVDISTLDVTPLKMTALDGYRQKVVSFTCHEEKERDLGGTDYQVPDQVNLITTAPGGWLSADVHLYKSSSDVRSSMSKNVGASGSLWKFAFSASESYTKMQHTIYNESRYILDTSSFESANRVDLLPSWSLALDSNAQAYLDRFIQNKTYKDDPRVYHRFIGHYGTHYFQTATFGGFIRVLHKTDTSYFYSHTDEEAKKNSKAGFLKIISAEGGSSSQKTTVDTQFTSKTAQTVKYYGGTTNLLSEKGVASWQPTVDSDPWLFSGKLEAISLLIPNGVHRVGMETAVRQHVLRNYLGELETLLAAVNKKTKDGTGIASLESRLTAMMALPLGSLVEEDVETLAHDIDGQVKVPSWFTENTQLCYAWRPDGDGGQCGGGAGRRLCAKPGHMTPVYRDDTDGRGGGCRMQWSIQSSGYDSWFSKVQVCYRWHADGDGGQCGGGAESQLCAAVNKFSPEYRDDTDGRAGGCQMSWSLRVPESGPVWLRTAEICFSWYPDGDGGQCGPARSRNLCARANEWTSNYRDDTDGRGGGCRMSWGLKLTI